MKSGLEKSIYYDSKEFQALASVHIHLILYHSLFLCFTGCFHSIYSEREVRKLSNQQFATVIPWPGMIFLAFPFAMYEITCFVSNGMTIKFSIRYRTYLQVQYTEFFSIYEYR